MPKLPDDDDPNNPAASVAPHGSLRAAAEESVESFRAAREAALNPDNSLFAAAMREQSLMSAIGTHRPPGGVHYSASRIVMDPRYREEIYRLRKASPAEIEAHNLSELPEESRLRYLRRARIAAEQRALVEARAAEARLAALARPVAAPGAPEPLPAPPPEPSPRVRSPQREKAIAAAKTRGDTLRAMSSRAFLARLAGHRREGLSDAQIAERYGMGADGLRALEAAKRGAKRPPQGK